MQRAGQWVLVDPEGLTWEREVEECWRKMTIDLVIHRGIGWELTRGQKLSHQHVFLFLLIIIFIFAACTFHSSNYLGPLPPNQPPPDFLSPCPAYHLHLCGKLIPPLAPRTYRNSFQVPSPQVLQPLIGILSRKCIIPFIFQSHYESL